MSRTRPRLELLVDEIVMRGLPASDARAVIAAMEVRLYQLGELWAASSEAIGTRDDAVRRSAPVTPASAAGADVGESVASAVWAIVAGGERR